MGLSKYILESIPHEIQVCHTRKINMNELRKNIKAIMLKLYFREKYILKK
jgi:hypothetical protein